MTQTRTSLMLAAVAIALLASPSLAGGDAVYANARYDYSVRYPAGLFTQQPEAANGDGAVFQGRGNRAEFRVWANYGAMDQSPGDMAREAEGDCARRPATYRVVKPNLVAVSCEMRGGRTLYEKQLIHAGLVTALRMTYPTAERKRWDPIVARISGSLRGGKG